MANVDATRGTVNHHLAILRRIGYISEHRDRKISCFAIAVAAHDSSKGAALALLRHPIRRGLLAMLRELGPSTASAIQRSWGAFVGGTSCPRSDKISFHAGLLLKSGLLSRQACGRSVKWVLRVDVEGMVRRQVEIFALEKGRALYDRIRTHGPTSIGELATSLGPDWPAQRVQNELRRLYAFGLLDLAGDRYFKPGNPGATHHSISLQEISVPEVRYEV